MAAEIPPSLVLVDVYRFGKGVRTVLNQLKAQGIPSPCLVLVEDRQQQQEAEEADVVLFKGVPAAHLFATIEGLLAESRKKGRQRSAVSGQPSAWNRNGTEPRGWPEEGQPLHPPFSSLSADC
jgi:hypothetical protein